MKTTAALLVLLLFSAVAAEQGARYLIITRDELTAAIQPLADWKHAAGMQCKVARLSETGSSLYDIHDYIQNAYDNWPVRPEFILLVGHPYYLPSARYGSGGWPFYSDNYYADMAGDHRAELPVGRFPVRTAAQCQTMVAKTLAYERDPWLTDSLWMRSLTTVIREDWDPDDSIYWNDIRYAAALAGAAGFVSCDSFSEMRGHNSYNVRTSVDAGTGLVLFRGCATGNWPPPFEMYPQQMTNGRKLPIILSMTCATMALNPYDSMVGSAWIKAGTAGGLKGAVAFFGNTHSDMGVARVRSVATRGFFTGLFTEGRYQLGLAMLRAKELMYEQFPHKTGDYRGFSLFGDPELKIWTATPRMLTVTHPDSIQPGPREIEITVAHNGNPIAEALVCASMDSAVYSRDYTDVQGRVVLSVNPDDTGLMRLVVTGRNCHPYDSTIVVTTQSGLEDENRPATFPPTARFAAIPTMFRQEVQFTLPAGGRRILIRDVSGRVVGTLGGTARQDVCWDGTDDAGRRVRAGVYFCSLLDRCGLTLARTRVTKLN